MKNQNWTRDELILAINLYYKTPFGKINKSNTEVIQLANLIGRTPSSISFKLGNFGSFDVNLKNRGVGGLPNTSKLDKQIWEEFSNNWDELIYESERLLAVYSNKPIEETAKIKTDDLPMGKEREAIVRVRVNQSFFRSTILSSYNLKCCITDLTIPDLLVASHIIPWGKDEKNRLNPHNGLCLNAIHDKAFDKGLITITHDYKVKISNQIKELHKEQSIQELFLKYENKTICTPDRFVPEKDFLSYHHNNIFRK